MIPIDPAKKIVLTPGYLLERIADEVVVYHPTRTTSLYLNETAAVIWELCDGSRSTNDIIALLQDLYPDSGEGIAGQVEDMIRRLAEKSLAEFKD
jgi:hypothetical protein